MKKKWNKKMPRPRQEIIDNPIPTSLFMCYAAVLLFVGTGDAILRILVNVYTIEKQRCRDSVINDFLSCVYRGRLVSKLHSDAFAKLEHVLLSFEYALFIRVWSLHLGMLFSVMPSLN